MPNINQPSRGNVQILSDDTIKLFVNKGTDLAMTVAADKGVTMSELAIAVVPSDITTPVFSGSGVDDLTADGTYTHTADLVYNVAIDSEGTPHSHNPEVLEVPDTFSWGTGASLTNGGTEIPIRGWAQPLSHGVSITFATTIGHTDTESWSFTGKRERTNLTLDAVTVREGLAGGLVDANGAAAITVATAANAVNGLTVTPSAAGGAVQFATTGGDASIDLQAIAKGTGGNILLGGYGGVAATAGAATGATQRGYVTSEALTTGAGASYVLTLTNPHIKANSVILASVENGTNTQGILVPGGSKAVSAGSGTITIHNLHATESLNGTILISYVIF